MNPEPSSAPAEVEKREDLEQTPQDATFWLGELAASGEREKDWRERAKKVVARYEDERERARSSIDSKRLNLLWSNTEVLAAALYQGTPAPDVRRRFLDTNDKRKRGIARTSALVLERALSYCADAYDFDEPAGLALLDQLLPGRGVLWVVYQPTIENDQITRQDLYTDYVHWEDYREGWSRDWPGMPWVARRHIFTKKALQRDFPDHAERIPLTWTVEGGKSEDGDTVKRAAVWEIWDGGEKQRLYVVEGYPHVLKSDPDPYGLRGFFPTPNPMRSVAKTRNRVPIPEFCMWQDQADIIDRCEQRIAVLTEALKRRGVYDGDAEDPNALAGLQTAEDNVFIPYKGYGGLKDKGGLKGVFETEDITPFATVLTALYQQREAAKQAVFEVTGISDIIRGSTDPNETKGAQVLKAQFGSMRMQKRQKEVQRYFRDVFAIKGEIIAEHFEPRILAEMTGVDIPPDRMTVEAAQMEVQRAQMMQQPPRPEAVEAAKATVTWEDVMGVLRSDDRRAYAIDVETDDTAFVDEQQEKQSAIEFATAMREMMADAVAASTTAPQILPLAKELIMFTTRRFKVGRVVEEAFEDAFDEMAQNAQRPQEDQSGKMDAEAKMAETKRKAAKDQADVELDRQRIGLEGERLKIDKVKAAADIMDMAREDVQEPGGMVQ